MNMCNSHNLETNFLIGLFKELHKRQLITKIQLDKCIQQVIKQAKEEKSL